MRASFLRSMLWTIEGQSQGQSERRRVSRTWYRLCEDARAQKLEPDNWASSMLDAGAAGWGDAYAMIQFISAYHPRWPAGGLQIVPSKSRSRQGWQVTE